MALFSYGPIWLWPYSVMALYSHGPIQLWPYMVMALYSYDHAAPQRALRLVLRHLHFSKKKYGPIMFGWLPVAGPAGPAVVCEP